MHYAGILSPLDEWKYWSDASGSASRLDAAERARHFCDLLKPLEQQFVHLDNLSLCEFS